MDSGPTPARTDRTTAGTIAPSSEATDRGAAVHPGQLSWQSVIRSPDVPGPPPAAVPFLGRLAEHGRVPGSAGLDLLARRIATASLHRHEPRGGSPEHPGPRSQPDGQQCRG